MEKAQTPKGFRDFLPPETRLRSFVVAVLKSVFEKYGFEPLETPTLEYASTLLGKYGEEADRLVYTFEDRGGRNLGLNYDLTVPTSRVLAGLGQNLKLPFKRYQIQRAYRAENPQKGRYREFTQCDLDTFGSSSPLADAEIIAVINEVLLTLGFRDFEIRINSRQNLFKILEEASILETSLKLSTLQTIDKLEKIGWEKVAAELVSKGLDERQIKALEIALDKSQPDENLTAVIAAAKLLGVPEEKLKFSPNMVRGLDYYTGAIFETFVTKPAIGSLTGGGRYDNLIEKLGGINLPATGTTIGLDRLCDVMTELGLVPESVKAPITTVLICLADFSPKVRDYALNIVTKLRGNGLAAEIYLGDKALDKQLKYASERKLSKVVIIGEQEVEDSTVTVKNMITGEQKNLPQEELISLCQKS